MTLTWEAIGVLAVIAGGVLGWLLKNTADITLLKSEVRHLREQAGDWESLGARLIRVEERLEVLVAKLDEIYKRFLARLEGK